MSSSLNRRRKETSHECLSSFTASHRTLSERDCAREVRVLDKRLSEPRRAAVQRMASPHLDRAQGRQVDQTPLHTGEPGKVSQGLREMDEGS